MSARGPCSSAPPDIRRTNRPVSFVVNGPLIGAGFYALLYAMSRIASDEPQAMTMISDKVPADLVAGFQQTVASTQNHIGGWYLLIGAIAGAIAWGFWHLWSGARGRPAPTGKALVLRILAAVFCIHSWVVIRALVLAPSTLPMMDEDGLGGALYTTLAQSLSENALYALEWGGGLVVLALFFRIAQRAGFHTIKNALSVHRWVLPVCGLIGCLALVWLLRSETFATPPKTDDNLVVIVVDSLRKDRIDTVDVRGVERMPNVTQLSKESLTFENAWSIVPGSLPAWVSLLTGQYPQTHGIRHEYPNNQRLARDRNTVFRTLRDKGWRTGVVAGNIGSPLTRLDLGFEVVRAPRATGHSSAELATYRTHHHLMAYLLQWPGHTRHLPILKRMTSSRTADEVTQEALAWIAGGDGRAFGLVVAYSAADMAPANDLAENPHGYDNAMRNIDESVGRFLNQLHVWGLTDRTHVVLTTTHGTHLGELDFGKGHNEHLYGQHALHIPLMIRQAKASTANQATDVLARSIDVAPTLLALLGLPPLADADGENLLAVHADTNQPKERSAFIEIPNPTLLTEQSSRRTQILTTIDPATDLQVREEPFELVLPAHLEDEVLVAKQRAMIAGSYKLVYTPQRSGVTWELYNMKVDPEERRNLIAKERDRFNALRPQLIEWILGDPAMTLAGDYLLPKTSP